MIIHHKGGDPAFFRVQRKQRGNGEVSVIALARKVGFSPPVVTILAKRPEKITRENEFELYGKWFSMILRCSLCSLTHTPISPILPLSKSEFLSLKGREGRSMIKTRQIILVMVIVFMFFFVIFVVNAQAATITVDTTADDDTSNGNCTLREAIIAANSDTAVDNCAAGSGQDTIQLPAGTYTLSIVGVNEDAAATGDLDITDDLILTGVETASTIIDGDGIDRVFQVIGTITVDISGVTIKNGYEGSSVGGGIRNEYATLTLNNITVSNNTAVHGGGIYNTTGGVLTLTNSTIQDNSASTYGGGIDNYGATLTLSNSTITGNNAGSNGGGIYNGVNTGTATLVNATITNNTTDNNSDGSGNGGGIYRSLGIINLKNTIIAGNIDTGGEAPDCGGTINSQDFNLLGDDSGCTFNTQPNDQVGTSSNPIDPLLGPLQDNGGPTLTHALLSGSPAIDAGDNVGSPPADQRGVTRPQDGDGDGSAICDIGAYEVAPITLIGPNGGEVIPSGSIHTIQWEAPPGAVSFKLKYSMDNGRTWKPIASGIPDTFYDWTVPTPVKNKKKCLVKVIGYDDSDKKVGADRSDSTFTIEVVKVTYPNGGELLTSGDQHSITWTTNETKNPVEKVVLKYTKNGGRTWKKITAIEGDNPGAHAWTVPDVSETKSKCKVKVVLKDAAGNTVGSDTSDGSFTIEPGP